MQVITLLVVPPSQRPSRAHGTVASLRAMPFSVLESRLDGPKLIEPKVFGDERGFFAETYRRRVRRARASPRRWSRTTTRARGAGSSAACTSRSAAGGASSCAARAARSSTSSSTCAAARRPTASGRRFELSDENMHMLYVPVGFAHGFCVTRDVADVLYKQDAYYAARPSGASPGTTPTSGSSGGCRPPSSGLRARPAAPRLREIAASCRSPVRRPRP